MHLNNSSVQVFEYFTRLFLQERERENNKEFDIEIDIVLRQQVFFLGL